VNPNCAIPNDGDAPEIRKYKKRFNGEILCAALWGVNLLIGESINNQSHNHID
jgi:misshapen/NIK-related kinase